jgi:hypothetical protein
MSSADKTKLDGIATSANNYTHPNHSGEVTSSGDGATTIANDVVTNAKLANMATATIKGRATASTGDPEDLSASSVRTLLNTDQVTDARTPTAHKASHATGGTDALAPSDIGAISQWSVFQETISASPTTLATGRARRITISTTLSTDTEVLLPTTGNQDADLFQLIRSGNIANGRILVKTSAGGSTLADLGTKDNEGRSFTFRWQTGGSFWAIVPVDAHGADKITSGTFDVARLPVGTGSTQVAAGNHTHVLADVTGAAASGSITSSGLTQATARILGRTTASTGAIEEITIGSGLSLSAGELSATGSGVTAVGASTADVLSVSGSDLVADDPNADRIVFWDDSESKLRYLEAGSGLSISGTTMTATGGIGGTTSTDNAIVRADSTSNTVQGSALLLDDATTSTQANVAIVNNHSETNSALVLTPKGTGAFIVGPKPDGTSTGGNSRGANSICIQRDRGASTQVASGTNSVAIGRRATASGNDGGSVAIGDTVSANNTVAIGRSITANQNYSVAIGYVHTISAQRGVIVGGTDVTVSGERGVCIGGSFNTVSGFGAIGIQSDASLRRQYANPTFSCVYWGGQTTSDTPTVLNLDATATNRFTIAANTALAVDILLVARRSDTQDKWLVARRFLGIRRDGSNNTSLIGSVQTLGVDQSAGSPTWTFALTADDTNEALQLEVTGAASETVQWRATAIYRVA